MTLDSRQEIAHLLRRAGFGAGPPELDRYAALGYAGAVERLLTPGAVDDRAAEQALSDLARGMDPATKIFDGQQLWLARMILTERPLQEKMTLFWHNHFATPFGKVRPLALMYDQAALFRSAGLGNFQDLLLAAARDPAMVIGLDGHLNVKRRPNENWARELMELFTIGIGNYSEQDVKEVARAFSGWGINYTTRRFEFHAPDHDNGAKTIFGQSGNWDGGDVVRMLAPRPETGKLLARKLWRWFVNDTPDADGVTKLAQVYLDSGMNIGAMLRWLFLSDAFRAEGGRSGVLKNPAEYVIGLVKMLGLGTPTYLQARVTGAGLQTMTWFCELMGLALYNPPNVAGWPGGTAWINPTTFFWRARLAQAFVAAEAEGRPVVDLAALVGSPTTPAEAVDTLLGALVNVPVPPAVRQALLDYAAGRVDDLKLRGLVRLIASSPSYQIN